MCSGGHNEDATFLVVQIAVRAQHENSRADSQEELKKLSLDDALNASSQIITYHCRYVDQ